MLNPFNHVDIRVECMSKSLPFYEVLLGALRFTGPEELTEEQGEWRVFRSSLQDPPSQFVGVIEEKDHRANSNRVAFHLGTRSQLDRVVASLRDTGTIVEGPATCSEYGSSFYAAFFEDPSGNRLELCCLRDDDRSLSGDFGIDAALASLELRDNHSVRAWRPSDFEAIQRLSSIEGWTTPELRPKETVLAWERSWPAIVALDSTEVVGFLRAISDFEVTTYVGEILVVKPHRGKGLGKALMAVCQSLVPRTRIDLLSVAGANRFYEAMQGQSFAGFRLPAST